jgi:hypothetical protein
MVTHKPDDVQAKKDATEPAARTGSAQTPIEDAAGHRGNFPGAARAELDGRLTVDVRGAGFSPAATDAQGNIRLAAVQPPPGNAVLTDAGGAATPGPHGEIRGQDGKLLSAQVKSGQGYYDVLKDMLKDADGGKGLDGGVLSKLAHEARALNGKSQLNKDNRFILPESVERYLSQQSPDKTESRPEAPHGRMANSPRPDRANLERDKRAEAVMSEFKEGLKTYGPHAGNHDIPDALTAMGLSKDEQAKVNADNQAHPGRTLADSVRARGYRNDAQIQKGFDNQHDMMRMDDENRRKMVAGLADYKLPGMEQQVIAGMKARDNGVQEQPGRQDAALKQFSQNPWDPVSADLRAQMTGLPPEKVDQIREAQKMGDKRQPEDIAQRMGYLDKEGAEKVKALYGKVDFIHDRAVAENWKSQVEQGADPAKLAADTGKVYDEFQKIQQARQQGQPTRPESDLVGVKSGGTMTPADAEKEAALLRRFDASLGPQEKTIPQGQTYSDKDLEGDARRILKARGESTEGDALTHEKERIAALNPGGFGNKVKLYSDEQLAGWREQAAARSVGTKEEYYKYNSGGKIDDAALKRAQDLHKAYEAVKGDQAPSVESLLKQGPGGDTIDKSAAAQEKMQQSMADFVKKYNADHPHRAPEMPDGFKLAREINGGYETPYGNPSDPTPGGPYGYKDNRLSSVEDWIAGRSDHVSAALNPGVMNQLWSPYDKNIAHAPKVICEYLDKKYAEVLRQKGLEHVPIIAEDTGPSVSRATLDVRYSTNKEAGDLVKGVHFKVYTWDGKTPVPPVN